MGRNEKKARKAVLAHAMTEVPDIMRATFKRDEKTYFFVDQPTVYKSNTQDVYVVFGTVRVDNGETSNLLQQAAAQKFQAPEEAEAAPAAETPAEAPAAEETEAVDETGHIARDCPNEPVCRKCGKSGHIARDCDQQ